MTRDMSLTLVLMAGSIAAAMAAPELGLGPSSVDECVEMRAVSSAAWAAEPFIVPAVGAAPMRRTHPAAGAGPRCQADDASAPYRMWHHGSHRVVPGCASLNAT
jgi:hypothetical protein